MMTIEERYKTDPVFRTLVDHMHTLFKSYCSTGARITPTEVREASGLAWQIYAERHPASIRVLAPMELHDN